MTSYLLQWANSMQFGTEISRYYFVSNFDEPWNSEGDYSSSSVVKDSAASNVVEYGSYVAEDDIPVDGDHSLLGEASSVDEDRCSSVFEDYGSSSAVKGDNGSRLSSSTLYLNKQFF